MFQDRLCKGVYGLIFYCKDIFINMCLIGNGKILNLS